MSRAMQLLLTGFVSAALSFGVGVAVGAAAARSGLLGNAAMPSFLANLTTTHGMVQHLKNHGMHFQAQPMDGGDAWIFCTFDDGQAVNIRLFAHANDAQDAATPGDIIWGRFVFSGAPAKVKQIRSILER